MVDAGMTIFWVNMDGTYAYWNRAAWQAHWNELRQQGTLRFETSLVTKDGASMPVEISANQVRFHELEYNCAVVRDIGERKKAQAELTEYRDHLEELVRRRTAEIERQKAELERLNRLFVGRELRMIELKGRIRELEGQGGGQTP